MSTLKLGISAGKPFNLPLEAITEKMAFIGRTGAGKTYGAMKLAETMLENGAQIVALDPVGVWRGLRMGGNFKVYIFGGLSPDYPLESTAGALLADLIVDRSISAVLDVSQFETDTEKARFAAAFADRFFFRKKSSPSPVHLFVEECQEFIPQNTQRGEERMLHAWQRIWKIGRNFGIGGSLITQRPQEVNKKALNQAGTLFVFQLTGPQERKAVEGWISDNGVTAPELHTLLPKLAVGSPHVWSPTFLECSETIKISPKITADISSTPKIGTASVAKVLTAIDGEKLKEAMAVTVENAKRNDPEELKKEIRRLKAELIEKSHPPAAVQFSPPLLTLKERKLVLDAFPLLQKIIDFDPSNGLRLSEAVTEERVFLRSESAPLVRALTDVLHAGIDNPDPEIKWFEKRKAPGDSTLTKAERLILSVLVTNAGFCSKEGVAVQACYAVGGGSFNNALSSLRVKGLITRDEFFTATPAGQGALGSPETILSGSSLVEQWCRQSLTKAESAILRALWSIHPHSMDKATLGKNTSYEPAGGSFNNALSHLRVLELITRDQQPRVSNYLLG